MSLPAFIDLTVEEQATELCSYFKALGASNVDDDQNSDLSNIVAVADLCFKEGNEGEAEGILNSIVSMVILLPNEKAEPIITTFCQKLAKPPSNKLGLICLRVLSVLFHGLDPVSSTRYTVYHTLVKVAGQVEQIKSVFTDLDKMRAQLGPCKPNNEQMQKLLRILHEALLNSRESELASKVMVELLSTYTTENASQAREEAQRCIVASLADPNTFLLDHLLTLQPVKVLEGALLHDLLTVFVTEKLSAYLKFYEEKKDFVEGLGLKHEQNLRKMRILTFMQLAENSVELPFETLEKQLQLTEDQVEEFVLQVLKTKLVRARMDQLNKKVLVSSTMHRTFGKQHWQQLRELLTTWRTQLRQVKDSMLTIVNEQAELLAQQS
ncbi:eukaryotic translation initiation factor 3 subunit M-like [Daphnia carinata]|uniref:eukaryotic translation initiation factor 3 subunit M-like n=1 Tax=Daphnia carinata TaxID=120202 RepID=UPI00257DE3AC|nr:eukaryotic translation initiation factor 3 subunit M-like [Daphnia carinata]